MNTKISEQQQVPQQGTTVFSASCTEFFTSATLEPVETTAGIYWDLPQGWSSFRMVSPLRKFMQLHFIFRTSTLSKLTLNLRDFNNDNFFVKHQTIAPGPLVRISTCCPEWLEVLDVFCPAPTQLLAIEGITLMKSYESYHMNSRHDLDIQGSEVDVKFETSAIKFSNRFNTPWSATIRPKNAFASETVYAEHFFAASQTQVFDGQTEEVFIKGAVTLVKSGRKTGLGETTVRCAEGGALSYRTEAMIAGNPIVQIRRLSENNTVGAINATSII